MGFDACCAALTVCIIAIEWSEWGTCAGAGVDSVREQEKLEARKLLENAAESPASLS